MLRSILNPEFKSAETFLDELLEWDKSRAAYEMQKQTPVPDDYLIAIVTEKAPEPLNSLMRGAPLDVRSSYTLLMEHLRQWNSSSVKYDSHGILMTNDAGAVGAVHGGDKGKGKFTDDSNWCGKKRHKMAAWS